MKKSFLVYHDNIRVFEKLSDEDRGKLFLSVCKYSEEGVVSDLPLHLELIFITLKQQIDRNKSNYNEKVEKLTQNAQKRWNNQPSMQLHANAGVKVKVKVKDIYINKSEKTEEQKHSEQKFDREMFGEQLNKLKCSFASLSQMKVS